jgi:nucleotidyltransferase/DNA polymerase involved in DNA repair
MSRETDIDAIIKANAHMTAAALQSMIMLTLGHVVAVGQIQNKLAALRAEEHTKRCPLHVTSVSGKSIALADLDAVIQYAIKGGMPPSFVK